MILEAGTIPVKPGDEAKFEAGFAQGRGVLEAAPGFRRVELRRGVESPSTYMLLVWWDSVDDHIAFTKSETYGALMGAIGPHVGGAPSIAHYGETL